MSNRKRIFDFWRKLQNFPLMYWWGVSRDPGNLFGNVMTRDSVHACFKNSHYSHLLITLSGKHLLFFLSLSISMIELKKLVVGDSGHRKRIWLNHLPSWMVAYLVDTEKLADTSLGSSKNEIHNVTWNNT